MEITVVGLNEIRCSFVQVVEEELAFLDGEDGCAGLSPIDSLQQSPGS